MAKQFILYNLKDEVSDQDFEEWVNTFKGPLISGLTAVKRYTLTKASGAMIADGAPPAPAESPFKWIGIVDLTSFEDYGKDQATEAYQKEFMPEFVKRVKNFLIIKADEVFDR